MKPKRSAAIKSLLLVIRRGHLYFGLLLMPWALLYGISGYLFNHPTHFAESSIRGFGRSAVQGTELAQLPEPNQIGRNVVEALNRRFHFDSPLVLQETSSANFEGDFFIASNEEPGRTVQLLLYRDGSGGTIRIQDHAPAPSDTERAAFEVKPPPSSTTGPSASQNTVSGQSDSRSESQIEPVQDIDPSTEPIRIARGLDQYCKNSLPTICDRLGLELMDMEFKVTTAPELVMQVVDEKRVWQVRYNTTTGAVSARPSSSVPNQPISWRRFLTRLHLVHGYPIETSARWFWAVVVDIMAFVMIFWGLSGLVMWWQIKRTRPWGTVALIGSVALAVVIAGGMLPLFR